MLIAARGQVCSPFGVSYSDVLHKSDEVAGHAKTLGAKFVRVAPLPDCQPFTEAITLRTAEEFNRIGKLYREKHGLIYCYHNHGCKFVPHGSGTLFDLLMDKTHPEDASYELVILWAFRPGADPPALLSKYGNRCKLLHLKDLKKGVKGGLCGKTPVENDAE